MSDTETRDDVNQRAAMKALRREWPGVAEELAAARAEVARLREVVEAVRSLVLDLNADADYLVPKRHLGDRLRAALAPVEPSGEAESEEAHCTQHDAHDPSCLWCQTAARDLRRATATWSAPVPSGGKADGGVRQSATKDARTIREGGYLAARPVLSREAPLRDALQFVAEFVASAGNGEGWTLKHVDAVARIAGGYSDVTEHDRSLARSVMGDAWLADVLAGEQR